MATLKVLIVDDEPGIRSGISRILRDFNVDFPFMDEEFSFDLLEAGSGEEAIELLNGNEIDIVLLDNKLPGIDGIEVLEYIRKKSYDICVMMITSYASLDLAVKATNNGAYNFVPKPFTPQELKTSMESITKHLYLRRMTRQLNKEGKQIRFQFLSVLSHELKSPINAIEGYLRVMKDRQAGDQLADYDVMIDRSMERIKGMRTLIMDMLDLTKLESGRKTRENTKVDICEIARICMDTIKPMAIQKNISLFFDSDEPHLYIDGNSEDIEIVMNNLLSNAVKYNKDGGNVYCSLKSNDGKAVVAVKDDGIGMSPEETSMLFGEFVRIKNAKTRNISGSGLGLSIVKKLVEELYSGNIRVESMPDQGSTFTVEIPLK